MATPEEFAQQYGDIAATVGRQLGVDPTVLLGQWGLETGWGKSVVPGTNNLGNIKDFSGGGVGATDNMTGSVDRYRKFDTPDAFANHYTSLITRKYPDAVGLGADAQAYANALKAGGYAEDPGYVDKIAATTDTVRRNPGIMERFSEALFPAAQAGTLGDEWGALEKRFSGQGIQTPESNDPWADLEQKFSRSQPSGSTPKTQTSEDNKGNWVRWQSDEPTLTQKLQASVPGRVLQGIRDPIDAGAQLLPRGLEQLTSAFGFAPNSVSQFFGDEAARVDEGITQNEQDYRKARQVTGSDGFDAARLIGNVASPANLALASRLPLAASTGMRALQGGVLGGVGGALQPIDTKNGQESFVVNKLAQIGLGATGGAVMTPIAGAAMDWVGKAVGRLKSAPGESDILRFAQEFSKDLGIDLRAASAQEQDEIVGAVRNALTKNKNLDPKAFARQQDFEGLGMQGTLGQITRDPRQFATERNLRQLPGTGDPLLERFSQQGRQMQQQVGRLAQGADESQIGGQRLIDALASYDDHLSSGVRSAYQAARQAAGKDAEIPMQGLAQDFADVLDSFGDKVPSGVRNQFVKYGIARGDGMTLRKLFTVEEADKLLKVINQNQSNDPATNAALTALRGAVKKAVVQDAGADDVFAPARAAAASRFRLQDAIPALESASKGRTNADDFVDRFVIGKSAKTEHVQQLAKLLKSESPESFDLAKAQIGQYLQNKAFGENLGGDKPFKAETYAKALREMGSGKLNAFFSPDEVANLRRLARVGAYMESVPNAAPVNFSGNWGAITNLASKIPGVPAVIGLGNAAKTAVGNQLAVGNALAAKVPGTAKLTPEQIAIFAKLLSVGALSGGGVSAQPVK